MWISILGYVPELIVAASVILFASSIAIGASSIPTKLGMAAWVIVELLLGAAVGYLAWHLYYAPYFTSRYNLD